jgi:hypothetical protein
MEVLTLCKKCTPFHSSNEMTNIEQCKDLVLGKIWNVDNAENGNFQK